MQPLTTSLLSRACRIFMDLAYPAGPASIPVKKRFYWELPGDKPITAYLPPAAEALGICQILPNKDGQPAGYEFRLGSSGFPHLKLRLQPVQHRGDHVWVAMVDTHDAFSREARRPPPEHPDAAPSALIASCQPAAQGTHRDSLRGKRAGYIHFIVA